MWRLDYSVMAFEQKIGFISAVRCSAGSQADGEYR